jgi:hypothetical protein
MIPQSLSVISFVVCIVCKIWVINVNYMPILTYGAGTWAWTEAYIVAFMAAEIRFLRNIEGLTKKAE